MNTPTPPDYKDFWTFAAMVCGIGIFIAAMNNHLVDPYVQQATIGMSSLASGMALAIVRGRMK